MPHVISKDGTKIAYEKTGRGTPPEVLEGIRKSPDWQVMVGVEHTLAYDYAILGEGEVPFDIAKAATMPTLVMDVGKSEAFMHQAYCGRKCPRKVLYRMKIHYFMRGD